MACLTEVGHTGYFNKFNDISISAYLANYGFTNISTSTKSMYFIIVNEGLLVIQIETIFPFDVKAVKSKYWLINNPKNINYLENLKHNDNDDLFVHLCNAHKNELKIYAISSDRPVYEYFVIMNRNGMNLARVDLHFNYQEGNLMVTSIFNKKGNFIQIHYDDYKKNTNALFSDFIEFAGNQFVVARLLNRKKNLEFDLMSNSDIVDTKSITLDNFHLFWERLTPEQITLIEMSAI